MGVVERKKIFNPDPSFHGEFDPDSYNDWEKELDSIFGRNNYTAEKRFRVAITGLYGYALD